MSTTFSRRSCRYSTSVTSSSSVESPATRRSACAVLAVELVAVGVAGVDVGRRACSAWRAPRAEAASTPARAARRARAARGRRRRRRRSSSASSQVQSSWLTLTLSSVGKFSAWPASITSRRLPASELQLRTISRAARRPRRRASRPPAASSAPSASTPAPRCCSPTRPRRRPAATCSTSAAAGGRSRSPSRSSHRDATVWAVDVNERALDLVRRNAATLGLTISTPCLPDDVPDDVRFDDDLVESADPGRQGRAARACSSTGCRGSTPGADAWLVVQTNLGSDSLHRWLRGRAAGRLRRRRGRRRTRATACSRVRAPLDALSARARASARASPVEDELGRAAQRDVLAVLASANIRTPSTPPGHLDAPLVRARPRRPSAASPAPRRPRRCRRTASRRCRARARASGCGRRRRRPADRPARRTRRSRRRRARGRAAGCSRGRAASSSASSASATTTCGLPTSMPRPGRATSRFLARTSGSPPSRRQRPRSTWKPLRLPLHVAHARRGCRSAGCRRRRARRGRCRAGSGRRRGCRCRTSPTGAVGVVVVHEPLGVRRPRRGPRRPSARLRGAHGADDAVGADAEVAVGRWRRSASGVRSSLAVGVGEQHEVVAGAVALGEVQIERHAAQSTVGALGRASSAPRDAVGVVGVEPARVAGSG